MTPFFNPPAEHAATFINFGQVRIQLDRFVVMLQSDIVVRRASLMPEKIASSMKKETELDVLRDIRALLRDLRFVLIDCVPENALKLSLHKEIEELSETMRIFPKTPWGTVESGVTVEYQGRQSSYADLLQKRQDAMNQLTVLIEQGPGIS